MRNIETNVGERNAYRPERPKNHTEALKKLLDAISKKINEEVKEQYGLSEFLNTDCSIAMEGFADMPDGIYPNDKIEKHKEEIHVMELDFSSANSPAVMEYYGIQNPEDMIRRWKDSKEKNKNGQTEMAITALLCKILKDDFLVVRTATYDDYRQGVDNIILNKHTGEVICAFDEVHEGGRGDRTQSKSEKVKKITERGGAAISYGIALKEGKLVRSRMENVPVFFLGLKSEELMNLLNGMKFDTETAATPIELEVFSNLVESLRQQQQQYLKNTKVPKIVQKKLESFDNSLAILEKIGAKLH